MSGLPSVGGGHGAWHHPAQQPPTAATTTTTAITAPNNKRKRRPAGTPDPDAEVVALSPKTLMESDRYVCEICNQGFQRDQNLQMHRRRHKVPWKLLKKPSSLGTNKRVYICPERSCLHHDPSHALGDLVGIKKHYRRKHCTEKQWKCVKCSKRYAVQSDFKAHLKTCGTRGHCCDCGRVFSRVESFIEHQDTCGAVKHKSTRQSGVGASERSSPAVQYTDRISISHDTRSQSSDSTQGMSFGFSGASDTATNSMPSAADARRIPEVQSTAAAAFNAAMPAWLMEVPRGGNNLKLEQSPNIYRPASIDAAAGPSRPSLQLSIGRAGSVEEATSPCLRLSIGPSAAVADTKPSWATTPSVCSVYPRAARPTFYGAGNGVPLCIREPVAAMEPAADPAASLRDFMGLSWRPSAAMHPGCVSR